MELTKMGFKKVSKNVELFLTNGDIVVGKINVEVEVVRASDFIKRDKHAFLTVYDAIVASKSDYERTLSVNKQHIVYAELME